MRRILCGVLVPLVAGMVMACDPADGEDLEERAELDWVGEELWELEQVPDEIPSHLPDDIIAEPDVQAAGWTPWYDRDNSSGNGDYESAHLQAGVCATPTGVECRTVNNLALWQTGEVVVCSTTTVHCINANQPDGYCNHDYKVRFFCP